MIKFNYWWKKLKEAWVFIFFLLFAFLRKCFSLFKLNNAKVFEALISKSWRKELVLNCFSQCFSLELRFCPFSFRITLIWCLDVKICKTIYFEIDKVIRRRHLWCENNFTLPCCTWENFSQHGNIGVVIRSLVHGQWIHVWTHIHSIWFNEVWITPIKSILLAFWLICSPLSGTFVYSEEVCEIAESSFIGRVNGCVWVPFRYVESGLLFAAY